MNGLRVPRFLEDLFWDLRDRRLMPLVVLIVVATAAAPFLLGGSSEAPPPLPSPSAAVAGFGSETAGSSTLNVVEAQPGLRDYHRRLEHRRPVDPFKQRFTAPDLTGAKLNGSASFHPTPLGTTTTTPAPSAEPPSAPEPTVVPPEKPGGAPSGPPSTSHETKPHIRLFAFAIDVKISRSGVEARVAAGETEREEAPKREAPDRKPSIKHAVMPATPLPGKKAPVVIYLGPSVKGKALLLVSQEVRSVFGEAKCVSGNGPCPLLEVDLGSPVTFVYGANEVRYRMNVLKMEPVPIAAF